MQLKKLSLGLLASSCALVPVLNAASNNAEVKFKQMHYEENKDRMKIDFSVLDFKKDFGTDYTLNLSLAYDTLSGGTPIWQDSSSGASPTITGNSNDDKCKNISCVNTKSNSELLSDGKASKDSFSYKNAQIDDTRKSISASLIKRTAKRDEITFGTAYSKEEDFKSTELSLAYLYNIDSSRNSTISAGISVQKNEVLHRREDNTYKEFDALNFQIGYTKILNKGFLAQINYFYSNQDGELSNPYQTIIRYFNISADKEKEVFNYFLAKEKRPDKKTSQGISLDSAYRYKKLASLHNSYRFYVDDWGINSHTLTSTAYIYLNKRYTFIPLLRLYKQTAANFYKAHDSSSFHFDKTSYGSSDERLGAYTGITGSLGLKYKVKKDLSFNLVGAAQRQSFGLNMTWLSAGVQYKF